MALGHLHNLHGGARRGRREEGGGGLTCCGSLTLNPVVDVLRHQAGQHSAAELSA